MSVDWEDLVLSAPLGEKNLFILTLVLLHVWSKSN